MKYCDRVVINMSDPTNTIEADTNGSIKLVSYLIPVYDDPVTKPTDITGFVANEGDENNGYNELYPEVQFIHAHSTQVLISPSLSRIGGKIVIKFP